MRLQIFQVIAQQWIQLNLGYASRQTLEDRLARLSGSSMAHAKRPARVENVVPLPKRVRPDSAPEGKKRNEKQQIGKGKQKTVERGDEALAGGEAIVTLVTSDQLALSAAVMAKSVVALDSGAWKGPPGDFGEASSGVSYLLVALVVKRGKQGEVSGKAIGWLESSGGFTSPMQRK